MSVRGAERPDARRRALLRAGGGALATWPWLAGCEQAPRDVVGGWLGADAARGHALRDGQLREGQLRDDKLTRVDARATRRCSVAVIGGGISGLAAARSLMRAGIDDLRVFELEDAAGGNARGHTMGGMRCPLGAHYLPAPGPHAHEVSEWLHEIGLARHDGLTGRTIYDERQLCHAPQERLFVAESLDARGARGASNGNARAGTPGAGRWLEGLLPLDGALPSTLTQLRRFSNEVRTLQSTLSFRMPTLRSHWSAGLSALDAQTFAAWLAASGYDDATLLAHLDYCCRDDYGAGLQLVSAWAGLHYFASRHGFRAPGSAADDAPADADTSEAVLTWPEGNAHLSERLASGLGDRLHAGTVITRISPTRHEVLIDTWNVRTSRTERWAAQQAIVCLPLFIAARLIDPLPAALQAIAPKLAYAPWLVSNLQLREPLQDRPGAAPAWDNVIAASPALGYVDAMHQSLRPVPGPTVLTHYWALGGQSISELKAQRARLMNAPWSQWRDAVIADLATAHPDLPGKLERMDSMRYGHAMVVPTPGLRSDAALAALALPQGRLHFAHADLSACSVFEEAFTRGALVGAELAERL